MQQDRLIALIDKNDKVIGFEEKQNVHEKGLLHRAFSIFIFNSQNKLLLHQRAQNKYHTPGLWTNTCCSHLLEGMTMEECSHDRLKFEMGFDCELTYKFSFTYKTTFGNGLTEHETDHVYIGYWEGIPNPSLVEVMGYKWLSKEEIQKSIIEKPENYTYWFKHIMENYANEIFGE